MKGCKGADAVAEVTKARREDMDFELESIRHAAFQRGWSPQEVRMVFSAGMAACSVIRPEMVPCRKIDAAVTVPPSAVVLVYLQEGTGADVCGLSLAEKVGLTAVEEGWDGISIIEPGTLVLTNRPFASGSPIDTEQGGEVRDVA